MMRNLTALLLSLVACAAANASCPDFSGRFTSVGGEIYRVYQTACTSIRLLHQEKVTAPASESSFVIDGRRYEKSGIHWAAFWMDDAFVREPWSSAEGGELVGEREVWTLKTESGSPLIHQQIVSVEDGTVLSEKKFRRSP